MISYSVSFSFCFQPDDEPGVNVGKKQTKRKHGDLSDGTAYFEQPPIPHGDFF